MIHFLTSASFGCGACKSYDQQAYALRVICAPFDCMYAKRDECTTSMDYRLMERADSFVTWVVCREQEVAARNSRIQSIRAEITNLQREVCS